MILSIYSRFKKLDCTLSMMGKRKGVLGLILKCTKPDARCDRCDVPLIHSTWNDVSVCYSISKTPRDGFICIQCALGHNRTYKPKTTTEEVDAFIEHLQEKQPVLAQH